MKSMASADAQTGPANMHVTSTGVHLTRGQLFTIMGGIMLGLLLSALDQTIVGPAIFRITTDLHGIEHYAWVATGYLLTSTITVPIVGKLGDLYGRKWFFVAGMAVFIAGSALCGLSQGTDSFALFCLHLSSLTTAIAHI